MKLKNRIHENLSKNKSISLRILLEDEKEDAFDAFDKEDEEDKKSEDDEESSDSKSEDSEEQDNEEQDEFDSKSVDDKSSALEQLKSLEDEVTTIKDYILGLKDGASTGKGTTSIESYLSSAIASESISENLKIIENIVKQNMNLNKFLFEDEDLEQIEDDLDDLDKILDKGSEIVNKFKKGKEINISSYANAAINAYKNFDSLFSKELIVKQAAINVIVLNSGAKAKVNVENFEEMFHKELYKNFGIEYEDHVVTSKKHKTASGAKSQG